MSNTEELDENIDNGESAVADNSSGSDKGLRTTNTNIEETIKANDIAIFEDGSIADGIVRFYSALSEMTNRRGMRNEISRYEAIALALVEPKGEEAGSVLTSFPPADSALHLSQFFSTIYRRYDERFVLGAPLLAERRITTRAEWADDSPVFTRLTSEAAAWPKLEFTPRMSAK